MVAKKKVRSKFPKKPMPQVSTTRLSKSARANTWQYVGFDLTLNSIAAASIAWDGILNEVRGPAFYFHSWTPEDDYFTRLRQLTKVSEIIWRMAAEMNLLCEYDHTFIAIEEPWPLGMVGRGNSQSLKQQAEFSGALMASLLRTGYPNLAQINAKSWQAVVAKDLGITTHHTKWGKGVEGKMRPKEWALKLKMEVPDWPDLILRNGLKIPRPDDSKAKAVQPNDCYDALGILKWLVKETKARKEILVQFRTKTA